MVIHLIAGINKMKTTIVLCLLTEKSMIFNVLQLKVKRQVTIFLKQECLLKIITCHPRREPLLLRSAAPDKRELWKLMRLVVIGQILIFYNMAPRLSGQNCKISFVLQFPKE